MPTPLPLPWQIVIGTDGLPVPGARLYAYRSGSTTLQTIYADPAYGVPLPNPAVADAFGVLPIIYLDNRGADYTLILTDADGTILPGRQADAIAAGGTGGGGGSGSNGENAFYAVLSRSTSTVPADSSGVVTSFASADGLLKVFNGGLDITPLCTLSITSQVNCTGTINTALDTPVVGQPTGYYRITAMSAEVAELRMHVVFGTLTTDAVFTLVKARQGADGAPGAPGGGANSIYMILSRPSAFATAFADGTVTTYAGINGLARMYDGTTEVTSSTTFSVSAASCTGTINTATNTPVNGQPRGYYEITAMTADTATLTVTGTYNSVTHNLVFTITKLKGGYEIVSVLPTTNLFQGRLVFLTTDNRLYRYTGTAWTTAVPATDITGLLSDAQIAAIAATKVTGLLTDAQIAAIAAAKLTGQITSTQIADDAITTPKLAAGAVTTAELAAGAITTDKIAANAVQANNILALSITGDKIAANTIVGGKIVAGSITGNEIAANTITSDKIQAGQIVAAQIAVTQLSAISANLGTITAGVLQNVGGTAKVDLNNGQIIFNNGAYMKVAGTGFGSAGQFIEWYGPTQSTLANCTEANAVYYLTVNGGAYFGGSLSAGKLINSGQTTDLSSSASITIGNFSTNGNVKSIVVSYNYHDSFRCNTNTGAIIGATGTATIVLEKEIDGGGFITIGTLNASEIVRNVEVDGEPTVPDLVTFTVAGSTTITDNQTATFFMKLRATITNRSFPAVNGTNKTLRINTQSVGIVSTE